MKNTGKHDVWLRKSQRYIVRCVYEEDGRFFMKYNRKLVELWQTHSYGYITLELI